MKSAVIVAAALAAVALGVAALVYGEMDDSPGLQAMGAAVIVGAVVGARGCRGGSRGPSTRGGRGRHGSLR